MALKIKPGCAVSSPSSSVSCDYCGEDTDDLHLYNGENVCVDCILDDLPKKDGFCEFCGDADTVYMYDGEDYCEWCLISVLPEIYYN